MASISTLIGILCVLYRNAHSYETIPGGEAFLNDQYDAWNKKYNSFKVLSQDERRQQSDEIISTFRNELEGIKFSGVFSNYTVLQRAPYLAALYGASDTPNTNIVLHFEDENGILVTYDGMTGDNGDWKVLLPTTYGNGGDYTVSVHCAACGGDSDSTDRIYHVTFGDVYYCAGTQWIYESMK